MIGETFPTVLGSAQAGDERALELLYRDLAPLVSGYLRSNGVMDEDVVSDVFVSMITGIASFSGGEHQFRSWLLTIAHRRMIDDRRRRGRRRESPIEDEDLVADELQVADSESESLARLRAQGVLDAIDELTPDQRAALMLRILADLPVREVAEIMGKPESAVKALLRRAYGNLARRVDDR